MGRKIFPWICLIALFFWIHDYFASISRADSLNFSTDHQYTNSKGTTKSKLTGEKVDSDYEQIIQLYNFNLSKNIYPYLVFNGGTVYQVTTNSTTTGDNNIDSEEKILTPFAELNLTNPIYQAGLAYHKRRIEEDVSDLPDTRADRDEITGTLGMNPPSDLFPDWTLRYSDIHTYDHPETQDQYQKVWMLDTNYAPVSGLLLDYSYARTDTNEKFLNFDTVEQSHLGTAQYSRGFLDQRLSMDTSYTINYNKFEFKRGSGSSEVPLLRFAGLSSLSNTPDDGPAMGPNPALTRSSIVPADWRCQSLRPRKLTK